MRIGLLSDTGGLQIAMTKRDRTCAYSGDTISEEDHGLLLQPIDEKSVWVSLQYWETLMNKLNRFDFDFQNPRLSISPTGSICYSTVRDSEPYCIICEGVLEDEEEGVVFVDDDIYTPIWCHIECVPQFCEGLSNIDNYSDEIVAHMV